MSFQITEVCGNIFSASSEFSLAHCVGADLTMGRGIATEFKNKFGQQQMLRSQQVRPGGVAFLKDGNRFIYYLVTKERSYDAGVYEPLFAALHAMRTHMVSKRKSCINNAVTKLAIPRLGSGLDKLNWQKVKAQIMDIFAHDSVEIVVYNYIRK